MQKNLLARADTDWPEDPRCIALGCNDSRWLYMCLWFCAIGGKSPIINPSKYTLEWFATHAGADQYELTERLRRLARQGLVSFTRAGNIVVPGVVSKMPLTIAWNTAVPEYKVYPWVDNPFWLYQGDSSDTELSGQVKEDKPKEVFKNALDGLPVLSAFYPRLCAKIHALYPTRFAMPQSGTQQDCDNRAVLAQLAKLDKHSEQEIEACLWWILTKEPQTGVFSWRRQFQSITGLRTNTRCGSQKFAQMYDAWSNAVGNSRFERRVETKRGRKHNLRYEYELVTPGIGNATVSKFIFYRENDDSGYHEFVLPEPMHERDAIIALLNHARAYYKGVPATEPEKAEFNVNELVKGIANGMS